MVKRLDNNNGVTLVEITIALLIVTVSVVALFYMFRQGYELVIEQKQRRLAYEIANQYLVDVQVDYYNRGQFVLGTDTHYDFLLPPDPEEDIPGVPVTTTVSKINYLQLPKVTIISSWEALSGRQYSIVLSQQMKSREG